MPFQERCAFGLIRSARGNQNERPAGGQPVVDGCLPIGAWLNPLHVESGRDAFLLQGARQILSDIKLLAGITDEDGCLFHLPTFL